MFMKRKKTNKQNQHNYQFPSIMGTDEYIWKAAETLIESQQGSVSTLQYKLKIGFNRALSIMEQLYQIGVVGEINDDTTSRDVLVDRNGLLEIAERLKNTKSPIFKEEYTIPKKENNMQSERVQIYNNQFDYMTGEDFEVFVAQILRKIGFTGIQLTKGSGDQGVDILAEKDGIKYAIQCKRYSQAVGNKAVQEVFAGKTFYHCHVGAVVTNNYFTQSAKDLARENGIVLWDKDFLNEHIEMINNQTPKLYKSCANSLKILDSKERIVAIEDGEISKSLYEYLDSTSRIAIDMYLRDGDGNPYTEDMIRNIEKPIKLYNVKLVQLFPYSIHLVYYCGINPNFQNTPSYKKLFELSNEHGRQYNDNLFKVDVYYGIDDIVLEDKDIKIGKLPEVNIDTDDMEGICLLENIDEYDEQTGHKYLVTQDFFPMKIDNIHIRNTK